MVASQLSGIVSQRQLVVRQLSSLTAYPTNEGQPLLVIIDLSHIDVSELPNFVQLVKSSSADTKILAFGPHVHGERLQAAKSAGCNYIAHRGGVGERLRELLRQ